MSKSGIGACFQEWSFVDPAQSVEISAGQKENL